MKIREQSGMDDDRSRFDASSAEDTMRELEEQYARGEIEKHAYFQKKHSLVRLYLKATTSPKRRHRDEFEE